MLTLSLIFFCYCLVIFVYLRESSTVALKSHNSLRFQVLVKVEASAKKYPMSTTTSFTGIVARRKSTRLLFHDLYHLLAEALLIFEIVCVISICHLATWSIVNNCKLLSWQKTYQMIGFTNSNRPKGAADTLKSMRTSFMRSCPTRSLLRCFLTLNKSLCGKWFYFFKSHDLGLYFLFS
jgi:hypothetical protein